LIRSGISGQDALDQRMSSSSSSSVMPAALLVQPAH
jgi:hypothetical protein